MPRRRTWTHLEADGISRTRDPAPRRYAGLVAPGLYCSYLTCFLFLYQFLSLCPVHLCKCLRTVLKTRVALREILGPHFTFPVVFETGTAGLRVLGGCLRGTGATILSVLELVAPRLSLVFLFWDLPGFLVVSCLMPTCWHGGPPPSQSCCVDV